MSVPSSTTPPEMSEPEHRQVLPVRVGTGRGRLFVMLGLLAVVVILASLVGQWWSGRQNSMVLGRPLSYPQTHLHTLVMGAGGRMVYLGTHFGLFTSSDGGRTWPQDRGALSTNMVTAVAISPSQPSYLAVLAVPTSGLGRQLGIYVSSNAGKDWRFTAPAGLSATAYPYTIQAAQGAGGHFYVFFSYAGWFETQDLGQHWQPITSGALSNILAPSLLSDPKDPAHLLMGGDLGLFETRDDGRNWQKIKGVSGTVLSLVATQAEGNILRSVLISTDQGLYRWQNAQSVTQLTDLPASSLPTRMALSDDGSMCYALFGSDLWFSSDLGTSWTHRWHFTRGDLVSLVLDPHNAHALLVGFYAPALVQISTDEGQTWQTLTH